MQVALALEIDRSIAHKSRAIQQVNQKLKSSFLNFDYGRGLEQLTVCAILVGADPHLFTRRGRSGSGRPSGSAVPVDR